MNTITTYKIFRSTKIFFAVLFVFLAVGVGSVSAQITQVGTAQSVYVGASDNTASVNIPNPSGINIGDILILTVSKYCSGNTSDPWIYQYDSTWKDWTMISSVAMNSANDVRSAVFYKVVDINDYYAGHVTVVFESSWYPIVTNGLVSLVAFTGVNSATPFDVTPGTITTPGNNTAATVNPPGITTASSNALVLMLGMSCNTGGTATTFNNTWSVATSPTLTENYDIQGTSSVAVGAAIGNKAIAGATGAGTITLSGNAYRGGIILALKPQVKQFRSSQSGSWDQTGVWQQSTDGGASWVSATSIPDARSSVNVQSGHTVTVSAANAFANDLTINGSVTISGTYSLTLTTTASINGTLTKQNTGSIVKGSGDITFNSGSTYVHACDGGTIPTAVWNVNSNCNITGTNTTQPAGLSQTFGNLTWNCTSQTVETVLGAGSTVISGTLTVSATNTVDLQITPSGQPTVSVGNYIQTGGTVYISRNSGTDRTLKVLGNFTINQNTATSSLIISTDYSTGTNTLNVGGNVTISAGTISVGKTTANSTTTLTAGGTFTETQGNFTAPATMSVTGDMTLTAGTFTAGTALTASGNWINNGGIFTAGTGTVTMNVTGKTIGGTSSTTFNNLTLGTGNTQAYSLGFGQTVNGLLNLQNNTKLTLGSYNLTLGTSATCNGTGAKGCWIVDNGSGKVQKMFIGTGSFLFPIGDGTYYSPLTLNFTQGSFTGAYVSVGVTNTAHPQNLNSINYFIRYWTVSQTGISSFLCNVTGTFGNDLPTGADWTVQNPAEYINGGWLPYTSPSNVSQTNPYYTFVANGVTAFGDFTAMGFPSITPGTPPSSFTYVHGAGPSTYKQLYVYGKNLIGSFIVTPPADYEISLDQTNFYSTPLTVPQAPTGTVTNVPIYIRLKAGLAIGGYNENITCSTAGLVATLVPVTGTVTSPTSKYCLVTENNTNYYISQVQFSGINNTSTGSTNGYSDYTATPTTVSVGTSYTLTVNVNTDSSGGKVSAKAWIDWNNDGTFNDDGSESYDLGSTTSSGVTSITPTITIPAGASVGTTRMRIACVYYNSVYPPCNTGFNGEVEDYTLNIIDPIAISTSSLSGFSYTSGSGPSGEQSFTVTGSGLGGDIIVTPAALSNFEISTVSGGIFSTSPITLHQTGGIVTKTTIYVRLIAGLSVGGYGPQNITLTSTGSPTKTVTCTGSVVPGITVGGGGSYCSTENIQLTSSTSINCTNIYWEGPNNYLATSTNLDITKPFNFNVSINPPIAGTYKATASFVNGGNLVINGNFSGGMTGYGGTSGFNSDYTPENPNGGNQILHPEGSYTVVANPNSVHDLFGNWPDHTTGSGLQLVINGATIANTNIWYETVSVTQNTNYQFTYWVQSMVATGNDPAPSQLQLYVTGNVSPKTAAGPIYTASPLGGKWLQFIYNWNSGTNTTALLSLVNQQTASGGNDFALDDIVFQPVYSSSASVNVSVITGSTAPTVSIAASPTGSVSAGTNVTFTATPTNGGHPPTYQWKVNSAIPATGVSTGSTYTYIPNNGDLVTCEMTSTSTCKTGNNPYISNVITMTVVTATKNYWKGAVDSNWSNPLNWTSNTIPSSGDNVEFSTASTIPWGDASRDLTLDNADRVINNLTNLSSKNLIIPPARCLTVNGIITTTGNANQIQIVADPSGIEQNGSLIFLQPTLNPSVTATVQMYARGSYNSMGSTYKGNTYHYSWQYFGIPVNTITASPTFNGSYVRRWNESGDSISNHWIQLGNSDQVSPFIGYELTQNAAGIITFQGQLQNGTYTSQSLVRDGGALFPGQYIFANPYTAAIDIQKFISRLSSANTDQSVYLYSTGSFADWGIATTLGTNAGQYQVVTSASGTGIPTQIPSMQAVIVKVLSPTTVTFNYSDVIKNNSLQRVKEDSGSTSSGMAYTIIDITGSDYSDRMWIFSDSTFTHQYDRGWDGTKMMGIALAPQLYAFEQDGNYQIDCVDDMNNTMLGFQRGIDTEYTLTFTHQNIKSKYVGVFLYDITENKTMDITESGSTYSFVAESTPAPVTRFKIVALPLENETPDASSQLKVFSSGNTVFVQNLSSLNGEMVIYDMMGRVLKKSTFVPYGISAVQVNTIPGAYVVNAATGTERVSKIIILGN